MSQPAEFAPGAPRWIELASSDPAAAAEFYTGLFGWTAETAPPEYGDYVTFSSEGRHVAGLGRSAAGTPDQWTVYLDVQDAAAVASLARENGGTVLAEFDVGGLGSSVLLTDASGARVGAWQNIAHSGIEVAAEPGAPVWFELQTRDFDAAVEFYRRVFAWQPAAFGDPSEMSYATLGSGDSAVAGIWDATAVLPEIASPSWVVYFGVGNANEAAVRITELGGTVLDRVMDSPFGRLAHAVDTTGAPFIIMQSDAVAH